MESSKSSSKSQKDFESIKVKKEISSSMMMDFEAKPIKVEKEITPSPDPTNPSPTDVVAVPTAESGANSVVVAAASEGQEDAGVADSLANKELEVDMTQSFLALPDSATEKAITRDMFKNCSIVVPLIALKKMKQCFQQEGVDPNLTMAFLGSATVQQYKISKPCLNGMVVVDAVEHGDVCWQRMASHFGTKPITALFLTLECEVSPQEVACFNVANKRGSLKSLLSPRRAVSYFSRRLFVGVCSKTNLLIPISFSFINMEARLGLF